MVRLTDKLNIDNLSKEEKVELFQLLEERERRLKSRRALYQPNEGQLKVHKSEAKIRCVFSGNGAGKTCLAVQEAVWMAQGYNPVLDVFTHVPARVVVVLDHPEKSETVWQSELSSWFDFKPSQFQKRGRHSISAIAFENGSEILFFTHSQDPLAFESIQIDGAIFDEPPPRHIWVGLRRAGRGKHSNARYLIVGTPISQAWMRQEILVPWQEGTLKDTECFTFGTNVNERNLADGYVESFSAILSEKEKRIRLFGEFYDLDGLALSHLYDQRHHEIEPFDWPEANPCVIAIDPHPSKSHHAILLGCDRDGYLYYIKELKRKCLPRDFARELRKWYQGFRVIDIVCDSLGSSEYTGGEGFRSFIQVLNDEGVRARATTWDEKNDEDFIQRIQGALALPTEPNNFGQIVPKLRIFRGNLGITADIQNVSWVRFRDRDEFKPKLDISNKDFLSCLKYALSTNLSPSKDKPKLIRKELPETYVGRPVNNTLQMAFKRRGARR